MIHRIVLILLILLGAAADAPQARAAINAAAVWRIRTDGSDNNGAGYDATISGAATDYSDQAAAQATGTDLAATAATSIVTSASAPFTAAMVGNAIRIRTTGTGAHFVTGYYYIVTYTSATQVTIDRDPTTGGNGVAGTFNVGGAALTIKKIFDSANATNEKCVAGNTVYLRGAGTDTPSSDDYVFTGYFTPVAGTTAAGMTKLLGYNGRPRLSCDGLTFYNCSYNWFEQLYVRTSGNNFSNIGVINAATTCHVRNVVINLSNSAGTGVKIAGSVIDCEIFGAASSRSAGNNGIILMGSGSRAVGNYVHNCWDVGIQEDTTTTYPASMIARNLVVSNKGNGVELNTTSANAAVLCEGNTIYGNAGHGISVASGGAMFSTIMNNIIDSHSGVGKYGLIIAGTLAVNNAGNGGIDYNNYHGNTADYSGISAGAHDSTLDPGFVNAGSFNWAIGTNLKALGFPGLFRNSATTSYVDIGGVQRQEAGGGGSSGILVNKGTSGGTQ